jgi:hypothetical protein
MWDFYKSRAQRRRKAAMRLVKYERFKLTDCPPMTKRIVHVAMGRVVIIDGNDDFSMWDFWSNHHRNVVSASAWSIREGFRYIL